MVGIVDVWGGFARDLAIRFEAGVDVELDLADGAALAAARADLPAISKSDRRALTALATKLSAATPPEITGPAGDARGDHGADAPNRRSAVTPPSPALTSSGSNVRLPGISAWYEMFPRSEGAVPPRSGTFKLAQRRLPAIAAMGFSVLYLPPIHPIGVTHRKGPNNVTECLARRPGEPVGDRLVRRWSHRGRPRARHHRRFR